MVWNDALCYRNEVSENADGARKAFHSIRNTFVTD
eukprot:COSAG06_NODE_65158_length_257_cov_1.854430_1_plen_34_part_10